MKIEVFADADSVARQAAALIAPEARATVAERVRFIIAISGGHTPWIMLNALAEEDVAWDKVHIIQVDERAAPAGHPDRNLTHLRESLLHFSARQGVEDDHMNILCMGGRTMGPALAWDLIETFLAAEFSGAERHLRRLSKVTLLEKGLNGR
jgi:6-phosphogluconolactonase/glucosamine-6-phosphate isomerase/deaminase